jgi:D-lyxose ketol-isomerase
MTTRPTTWFRDPIGRFSEIEEDVAPTHLLVSDYAKWLG